MRKMLFLAMAIFLVLVHQVAAQFNATLNLERRDYLQGEKLEGSLSIEFTGPFDADTVIYGVLGNNATNKTIKSILDSEKISYKISPKRQEPENPEQEKTITFEKTGEKLLAFMLPKNIENITDFEMSLKGEPGGSIKAPKLDIGNDDRVEWNFLGSFSSWGNFSKSEDLEEGNEGEAYITENMTGYCAMIKLPYSKHFKIYAKYAKVGNKGDIKATFLSVPSGDPTSGATGGADVCDLEESSTYDWHSCDIELPYVPTGDNLVCIYSETGEGQMYKIAIDAGQETLTSYTCPIGEDQLCRLSSTTDFFVKVKGADYDSSFSSTAKLKDWQTSPDAAARALKHYLSEKCTGLICAVPLKLHANGTGSIKIGNIKVSYIQDGILQVAKAVYDLRLIKEKIISVDGVNLNVTTNKNETANKTGQQENSAGENDTQKNTAENNATNSSTNEGSPDQSSASESVKHPSISVDLASLFVRVPLNVTDGQSFNIAVKIGDEEVAKDKITVYKTELPVNKLKQQMTEAVYKNYAFMQQNYNSIMELLGLNRDIENAKSRLQSLAGKTAENLRKEVQAIINNTPKQITKIQEQTGYPRVSVDDVPPEIGVDVQKVMQMQKNIVPKTTVEKFKIEYYNGTEIHVVKITKNIAFKEPKSNVDIYEVLPNIGIIPDVTPSEYVVDRRLVRWHYDDASEEVISYVTFDEIYSLNDLKTIAVWEEETEQGCMSDYDCAEGETCNASGECVPAVETGQMPMGLIAGVGFAVALVAILVLLLKSPFKDKQQLNAIINFISQMEANNYKSKDIKIMLEQKGWTKRQIQYAFMKSWMLKNFSKFKLGIKVKR